MLKGFDRAAHKGKTQISAFFGKATGRAFGIASAYVFIALMWIVLTDLFFSKLLIQPSTREGFWAIQLTFVGLSAVLIYIHVSNSLKRGAKSRDALKQINRDLEESNRLYKGLYRDYEKRKILMDALIDSIPDFIFYKDLNGVYLGCNQELLKLYGLRREDIIDKKDDEVFPPEKAAFFTGTDAEILENGGWLRLDECITSPDGEDKLYEIIKTPYYDYDGKIIGLIGISRDLTDRKKKEEEILYLSEHDPLTGLYNRSHLMRMQDSIDIPENLPISVIMGDINGLKVINDTLGHEEGDRVIAGVADVIKGCCRDGDIAARTGGDEFTVLMPKTDRKTADEIAERMDRACGEWAEREGSDIVRISIAFGHATKELPREDRVTVRQQAEEKMYRHKMLEYKSFRSGLLDSYKRTMLEKSYETEEHAERMEELSRRLGKVLELRPEELVDLQLLSILHDVGKISIDKEVLLKSRPLTEEDWKELRKHPEVGYRILRTSPDLLHIAEYVLCHHERWDGTGYPRGLKGEDIPLLSRVIAVVDAYDAMTQNRGYRPAKSKEQAAAEIMRNAGTQFDPRVAFAFVEKVLSR